MQVNKLMQEKCSASEKHPAGFAATRRTEQKCIPDVAEELYFIQQDKEGEKTR